jgi:hypothetical protein
VANNTHELEGVTYANGFGGITNIELGDGFPYVLSYAHRLIYRIVPNN